MQMNKLNNVLIKSPCSCCPYLPKNRQVYTGTLLSIIGVNIKGADHKLIDDLSRTKKVWSIIFELIVKVIFSCFKYKELFRFP